MQSYLHYRPHLSFDGIFVRFIIIFHNRRKRMRTFVTSRQWQDYYRANAVAQLPIPWDAGRQLSRPNRVPS